MKLHFENICKVSSADVDLEGITVIVGNNDTGKSTTGKVLWAMFEAFADLPEKVFRGRAVDYFSFLRRVYSFNREGITVARYISKKLAAHEISVEDAIEELKTTWQKGMFTRSKEPDWELYAKRLMEMSEISDEEYQSQMIADCFGNVFNDQYVPLFSERTVPYAKMSLPEKGTVSVRFTQEIPEIVHQLELNNNAFFFDAPVQLEALESLAGGTFEGQLERIRRSYKSLPGIAEGILLRNKFESIGKMLTELLGGEVVYEEESGFEFASSNFSQTLKLGNLSQGVKAIALLQTAFSRGAIKDGDVLILDEPEIHLHPEWQVRYAEFIVLLQKAFHLTVLLTSHSPDFVEAIRLFSRKHGLDGKLNGYLSVLQEDGRATLEKVPDDDWDKMFTKFADSFRMLMRLREELEERKDD